MFFKNKKKDLESSKPDDKLPTNPIENVIKDANNTPQVCVKKIKKPKPVWDNSFKLTAVQYPEELLNEKYKKKKYKINIAYKAGDKLHKKTIRFGKRDDPDFVDGGDVSKKNRLSSKLGNTHNMFHGNFWRLHLLNGDSKTLKENYLNFIKKI